MEAFAASRSLFAELTDRLAAVESDGWSHHEIEEHIEASGRELLRQLFQDRLDLRQLREERAHANGGTARVVEAGGNVHARVEKDHSRGMASLFGAVRIGRLAYRAAGRPNLYLADAVLNLPARSHSHGLRRLAAREAIRGSFDAAHAAITDRCGPVIGKRQVEELTVATARDIEKFYASRPPQPYTDGTLLILSTDAKGVVMRPEALRDQTAKAARAKGGNTYRTRLAGGEKNGRKRMATLGAVYDAEPVPRRPHHVVTLTEPDTTTTSSNNIGTGTGTGSEHAGHHRKGPKAKNKWLTASIAQTSAQVIADVFDQAEHRDPQHRRRWIMLVDGARHQLDLIQAEAARRGVDLHILIDFIHVIEYVWKAAWCFHTNGDPAAERWVATHAVKILAGYSQDVATTLGRQATEAGLSADQRKGVDACIGYLTAKQEWLGYDVALNEGWPIATGVIEGACRHLIGDRLDITGARWGLDGAEAVLKLRAVTSNGDFDEYFTYHVEQERQRVHQTRYQHEFTLEA
ncbi:ISKra4 family transposase [Streptomyces sp. NPDC005574]|uniref:ISKra4 family transposase n=1 Tax=Streptomyces sp. NPDC005574 TaxID=3156891 RepID=UPI0033A0C5C1